MNFDKKSFDKLPTFKPKAKAGKMVKKSAKKK
jgi:hypothetical protein